jgi:hypothetical protein
MHLRHIRPRSVDWYDALETEGGARAIVARMSEEAVQLKALRELDRLPERKQSPRDRGRNYDS